MSKTLLAALGTAFAATLFLGSASPAGTASPQRIRHVRIGDFQGPAYYSVVDGGFRAIHARTVTAAAGETALAPAELAN